MPFYVRQISPLRRADDRPRPEQSAVGDDCDAAANAALTGALRQLSSLALAAEDIFQELHDGFVAVSERAEALRSRVEGVRRKVHHFRSTDTPIRECPELPVSVAGCHSAVVLLFRCFLENPLDM